MRSEKIRLGNMITKKSKEKGSVLYKELHLTRTMSNINQRRCIAEESIEGAHERTATKQVTAQAHFLRRNYQ